MKYLGHIWDWDLRLYLKYWLPHPILWLHLHRLEKEYDLNRFMMPHCWLSDSRAQLSSCDLGASDNVGLLSACDSNPHSYHTLQVCEHNNTTAHSTQELISGQV